MQMMLFQHTPVRISIPMATAFLMLPMLLLMVFEQLPLTPPGLIAMTIMMVLKMRMMHFHWTQLNLQKQIPLQPIAMVMVCQTLMMPSLIM